MTSPALLAAHSARKPRQGEHRRLHAYVSLNNYRGLCGALLEFGGWNDKRSFDRRSEAACKECAARCHRMEKT